MSAARKKAALQLARDYLEQVPLDQSEEENQPVSGATSPSPGTSVDSDVPDCHSPPAKKRRVFDFKDLCDPEDDQQQSRNELAEYVNLKSAQDSDILQFWKDNRLLFPKLFQVANRVLCIPATSSASERVFSLAGRTLEKRRARLSSDTVNGLLFLHSNWS